MMNFFAVIHHHPSIIHSFIHYFMTKSLPFTLALAFALFFYLPNASAQGSPSPCEGCAHAAPTAVYTSIKNSVTIAGAPDGKGKPVEFQVFTQDKDGAWKLENVGQVLVPGKKVTYNYYRPTQVMVLVYCETPFGNMVEFSNVRVAPPSNKN